MSEKEYIEREAAFELITDFAGQASTKSAYAAFWKSANAIKNMATADVVEVRHGEWVEHTEIGAMNNRLNCSVCNWKTVFCVMGEREYKYCPNCGAKMDGKGEGEC